MCLTLKTTEEHQLKIAKEDIKVYKKLKESTWGRWVTPYEKFRVKFEKELPEVELGKKGHRVFEGYHTFQFKTDALEAVKCYNNIWPASWNIKCTLFEAIIPKGSKYYEGVDDDKVKSIVSTRLIILKKTVEG